MSASEQKKNNRKMGLILASIVVVFFLGFMAKMYVMSH
jgi:flagellar basal body-associated protein FliL